VPSGPTTISAVDDDRMLLDGLTAWFSGRTDLEMIFTCGSVDELIRDEPAPADVVLLKPVPRDRDEPALDVRRLVEAGRRVLVVSSGPNANQIRAAMHAGASGYVTKDRDLVTLEMAIRRVVAGSPPDPVDPVPPEQPGAEQPGADPTGLAPRERELLLAYVSGMTMAAAARRVGVRPSTARTYLERIKKKYTGAGRPTYTKLDLAARAREDRLSGQST
jgi:two-component system nitrate/nitrite response regulator NarL